MPNPQWQKSTYSPDASNCVYVAATPTGAIHLRESDDPEITLSTTRAPMSALIRTLKAPPSARST
ncbi:DUF397 domain-containing protein [Streptomyces sp. 2A115]|uniref:DUF397 domain-containing protein n=1 Tax=Streptomyces sp. 2A115 TaxID=3457439 RepID=UPI003FD5799F